MLPLGPSSEHAGTARHWNSPGDSPCLPYRSTLLKTSCIIISGAVGGLGETGQAEWNLNELMTKTTSSKGARSGDTQQMQQPRGFDSSDSTWPEHTFGMETREPAAAGDARECAIGFGQMRLARSVSTG